MDNRLRYATRFLPVRKFEEVLNELMRGKLLRHVYSYLEVLVQVVVRSAAVSAASDTEYGWRFLITAGDRVSLTR